MTQAHTRRVTKLFDDHCAFGLFLQGGLNLGRKRIHETSSISFSVPSLAIWTSFVWPSTIILGLVNRLSIFSLSNESPDHGSLSLPPYQVTSNLNEVALSWNKPANPQEFRDSVDGVSMGASVKQQRNSAFDSMDLSLGLPPQRI